MNRPPNPTSATQRPNAPEAPSGGASSHVGPAPRSGPASHVGPSVSTGADSLVPPSGRPQAWAARSSHTPPGGRGAAVVWVAVLVATMWAGCVDSGPATTELSVVASGLEPIHGFVPYRDAPFPAAARFEADGQAHPGHYTPLDQLEAAAQAGLLTYHAVHARDLGFDPSLGHMLVSVDGVSADASYQYWALRQGGQLASEGMSTLRLEPGDQVSWTLEAFGPAPGQDGPESGPGLALSVSEERTRNQSVRVTISTQRAATVSVQVVPAPGGKAAPATSMEVEGDATLDVAIAYGRSTIRAVADDGRTTQAAEVPVARLAPFHVEVHYNGLAPGRPDTNHTVWMDIHAFASLPMYEAQDASHPGTANAHDLLVAWEKQTGSTVQYRYSQEFEQFSVERINGHGNPVTASAPPWWCYTIGGEAAEGITIQAVAPGATMVWDLGDCSIVPV